MSWRRLPLGMTKKIISPRTRGRPLKPIPRFDTTPEQVARAIFSGVKQLDPSIRVRKPQARRPKSAQ